MPRNPAGTRVPATNRTVAVARTGPVPDVTITTNRTTAFMTANHDTGFVHINSHLWSGNATAVASAKTLMGQMSTFCESHIMGFGQLDPWNDPAAAVPGVTDTRWNSLANGIQASLDAGVEPMIVLYVLPWWMRGHLKATGTTYIPTLTQDYNATGDGATPSSRLLDDKFPEWLSLVDKCVRKFAAAPYNVKYWMIGNELQGYYVPTFTTNPNATLFPANQQNRYDCRNQSGTPAGANAHHGYTYFYNQTRAQIVSSAAAIGATGIKTGGAYPVCPTYDGPVPSGFTSAEPGMSGELYGNWDDRFIQNVKQWFSLRTPGPAGSEFFGWDARNRNKNTNTAGVDAWTDCKKFYDFCVWLRGLNTTTYPGADSLAIYCMEMYCGYYDTVLGGHTNQELASVHAEGLIQHMLGVGTAGGGALKWGADGAEDNVLLWTSTQNVGGGVALPGQLAIKVVKDTFPRGTALYPVTNSNTAVVRAVATATKVFLINKTDTAKVLLINGTSISLAAYEVKAVIV